MSRSILNISTLRSEARLAFHEWKSLIGESLAYELQKRVVDSHLLGPTHAALRNLEDNVKQIASRGFAARVKLTRIMVRMASAFLNNNREAFERAIMDLIQLGKKVSQ
ncbi:MAG: hypothetical protein FJY29_11900 [Betaproteobacteria bacterium]|nr:hypothetical protein [Betaproteobacteria bacterium]